MKNYADKLVRKAGRSSCRYKVSAIALDARGQVLACAFNSPRFAKIHGGEHAEIAVLKKSCIDKIKNIIIARVNKRGELLPIKPCSTCAYVLSKLGIKIQTLRKREDNL